MKKTLYICLLTIFMFIEPSFARESSGYKFWRGTGGALVIGGLVYWMFWPDDKPSSGFTLTRKPQILFGKTTTSNSQIDSNLFYRYTFNINAPTKPYVFTSQIENESWLFADNLKRSDLSIQGIGLNLYKSKSADLDIEYSEFYFNDSIKFSSVELSYRFSF